MMTKKVDGITIYEFSEWKKIPEVTELTEDAEQCWECDGNKSHTCDCGDEHDCGFCDGSGLEPGADLREIYEKELRAEIKRLKAYIEKFTSKKPAGEQG